MITCQECTDLQAKGFFQCTSAERVAISKHFNSCEKCEAEMVRRGLEAKEKMNATPEQLREITAITLDTWIKDRSDPENK
jgi:hypothetical protein